MAELALPTVCFIFTCVYSIHSDPGAKTAEGDGKGGQNLIHLATLAKGTAVDFKSVIGKIYSKFPRCIIIILHIIRTHTLQSHAPGITVSCICCWLWLAWLNFTTSLY